MSVRPDCSLQMRVTARDLGTPQLSSVPIEVTIFVVRNNNPPVFVNLPYTTQIEETSNIGRSVYRVTTTDADVQVRFHSSFLHDLMSVIALISLSINIKLSSAVCTCVSSSLKFCILHMHHLLN